MTLPLEDFLAEFVEPLLAQYEDPQDQFLIKLLARIYSGISGGWRPVPKAFTPHSTYFFDD